MTPRNIPVRNLGTVALIAGLSACAADPNYGGTPDGGEPDTGAPDTGATTDASPNNPVPPPAGVVAAGVRWIGRVDTTNAAQPRFSWSGSGFAARFNGTSLAAQLNVTGASAIFKAVVDGAPQAAFTAASGQATVMLASGLAAGVHTVELYRQTEGAQGETRLMGLTVGDGTLTDPPAGASRLIEVIGDSITCGYGVLGTLNDQDCFPTESHWDTYAAVAGRALGAEVSTIAVSGKGVIRNYDPNDTSARMPMLYPRAITNAATPVWDFHVEPQVVVINLGTNDISNNKGDPGDAFRDAYVTLLQTIRAEYPHAYIICIIAPLLNGGDLSTIGGHLRDAVAARAAAGDTNVEFFGNIPAQSSDKFACQYHPNVAENQMISDLLVAEIKSKLGW